MNDPERLSSPGLRGQGLRRRSRSRAPAQRPRGHGRRDPPPAVGRDRPVPGTRAGDSDRQHSPLRGESVAVGAAGRQRGRRGDAGRGGAPGVPRGNRPAAGHRGTAGRDVSHAGLLRRGDVLLSCFRAERAGARGGRTKTRTSRSRPSPSKRHERWCGAARSST